MTLKNSQNSLEGFTQEELFEKINEICSVVNTVRSNKELLEISLKLIMELFDASRGSIFILKKNSDDLILEIAEGMALDEQKSMVKRFGEGIVGQVAQIKKPIFVDDIAKDERFKNYKPRKSYKTPSFICAPLLVKDHLIGVINLTDKESGNRFKKDELQLLDFLSTQIALNYRRIQLYDKFQNIVKEKESLRNQLGKSSIEAKYLKNQIVVHEKLASIGKLAGGIAHEFNNPLDGVMRYTNLCLEHIQEEEVIYGYLIEIKQGLIRMANIVKSLLACSRNETPTMEKVSLNYIIEQVLLNMQTEISQKNINIKENYTDNLPELIDVGLERAVSNILRNAIDAVDIGGTIEITAKLEDQSVKISIKDNGCGIEKENIQKIFDPFFTTKDIDKGCGLGLTIVSEIIKSYNGQISVHSTPQKGTTFTIIIPIQNI